MSIKLSVLASGSKGNSLYVATDKVRLLVDAGLSAREIERRLEMIGVDPRSLDAIVVTHEHIDHVRSVGTLSRRYHLPVYLNRGTQAQLPENIGLLSEKVELKTGRDFAIADLTIRPFSISHDAADPVGFTLVNEKVKIGLCTDLGAATKLVLRHLEACTVLILEANHDEEMLHNGPYPWPVKQRIKSRVGHLSNEQSAGVLAHVFNENLKGVILAHMSETNNSSDIVLKTFMDMLDHPIRDHVKITLASQHHPLDPIVLT
jgi:phosphoribosyl 1,2-cyclic phosphodiesterase